jgi:hypothetical protein
MASWPLGGCSGMHSVHRLPIPTSLRLPQCVLVLTTWTWSRLWQCWKFHLRATTELCAHLCRVCCLNLCWLHATQDQALQKVVKCSSYDLCCAGPLVG